MDVELFAGIAVSDLERAIDWYGRFFGGTESFEPNDTERARAVAEHRYLYVELEPEHAGHAMVTYQNGVRKVIDRDPDGNEVAVGGAPVEPGTKL
jgi:catechol 2,3-dioxygenase-like lactoylglutathione lyase family enzyme